ncbi:MAG: GNAT family N-acetyltransferase [Thermoplasmatota archaeon]|nr:GNAT family N-acetyltransferase [Halobacteriales archaeon]
MAKPRARIRRSRVGDLGWAFQRQAVIYHGEFGYLPIFETYLAQGLAPFLEGFDAKLDAAWVAQAGNVPLGFVAIQHDPGRPGWAKLRWFFVEEAGRGQGLGRRLLATALSFSRSVGHRGVYLWTVDDLDAARRQYERAGFALAHEARAPCRWAPWGHEQRWEIEFPRRGRTRRKTALSASRHRAP